MSSHLQFSRNKLRTILILSLFAIFAFAPIVMPPPGLSSPEPIGPYLNGTFPSVLTTGTVKLEAAFPNLSFNSPLTWATHPHDNKIFVGQRDGKVYYFTDDDNVSSKTLFLDLSPNVGVVWDGGFLGFAFHPNFGKTGAQGRNYFFVYYSTPDINDRNDRPTPQRCPEDALYDGSYLVLQRYEVNEGSLQVDRSKTIDMFRVRLYNSTHRGGGLVFGQDGLLYLTTGDQAQHSTAQDMSTNLDGGVLRFDVDMDPNRSHAPTYLMPKDLPRAPDETSGNGYFIPNDNPFVGQANVFEEYYTLGHRNPHRMTMDRLTGTMYIGEVGSGNHEEINVVSKGKNYGWPVWEGSLRKNVCTSDLYPGTSHTLPLTAFPRSEANSLIGGYVYRGGAIPALQGRYMCADWGGGGEVWSVDPLTGIYTQIEATAKPISFGEDKEGELYILRQGDGLQLQKIVPVLSTDNAPPTLSQTGAFKNLNTLEPVDGFIPYDMYESFWSDGAVKKRWMAVPNDGSHNTAAEQIQYSQDGEWKFPEGSVLIKHFDLPLDESNPSLIRRLETRFTIVGQNGQVYGVTYKWRSDGSDADLLETSLDEDISIQTATGPRTQTWHYPSRSECLTCHNEAVDGTLGPRTRYLNTNITYPSTGINANQLVTLSALGILNTNITDANVGSLPKNIRQDEINASLEVRSRSYLDLNCGYCHRPGGNGGRAVFDARISTPLANSELFTDEVNVSLGIPDERIIFKGDINKSILYQRIHSTVPGIAMPPLAKNEIDEQGAALIAQWIGSLEEENCEEVNIALGKTATQSSTLLSTRNFDPGNAIDGNRDGDHNNNSITHTNREAHAWWEIDLGEIYDLSKINLWNRTDCCTYRLSNFYVFSSKQPFASQDFQTTLNQSGVEVKRFNGTVSRNASIALNTHARYLRVQLAETGILTIAEAEIFTCIAPPPPCEEINVSQGKSATQSSTFASRLSFEANNATDGNRNGASTGNSITHTNNEANAWWEIDLGQIYNLSKISLWNRTDCCGERLADFYVLTSEEPFASKDLQSTINQSGVQAKKFSATVGRNKELSLHTPARYVRVQLAGTGVLSIAEAEIMACTPPPPPTCVTTNVGLGKTATQSSQGWGGDPSRALDGNKDGIYNRRSITHTLNDQNAWWEVDLGQIYTLSEVKLWNRTDCCSDRLSDFYVLSSEIPFTSKDLQTTLSQGGVRIHRFTGQAGRESSIFLNNQEARYLRVQLAGRGYLSIAEAEIMACGAPAANCVEKNVAQGKSARQSSQGFGGIPSRAIDGNNDGVYANQTSTHTNNEANAWWEVDLGQVYSLSKLRLWNRTDCCADRLSNFYVLTSERPFSSTDLNTSLNQTGVNSVSYTGTVGRSADIALNTSARYLRVQLAGTGTLTIAEAEVMACGPEPVNCTSSNLALGKTTKQSSMGWGGVSTRAVDGNREGIYNLGSITHTLAEQHAWWEVDLGAVSYLEEINLWNRTDCCGSRLSDFYVITSEQPFSSQDLNTSLTGPGVRAFHYPGTVGRNAKIALVTEARYVRVQLAGRNYLSIAEAEIMGCVSASPATLSSLHAKQDLEVSQKADNAQLSWSNPFEMSVAYQLERSIDGLIYERIYELPEKEVSPSPTAVFSYLDKEIGSLGVDKIYYRLQAHTAGAQTQSPTKELDIDFTEKLQLSAYPNPANTTIQVDYVFSLDESFHLEIISNLGQKVYQEELEMSEGSIYLDISNYGNGLYFFVLKGESQQKVLKVFKR
ncbi:MAG: discoidin domain-containing protein [Bacteroidota bacterium]